jgi:hypothetical protein
MKYLFLIAVLAAIALSAFAAVGRADPPGMLYNPVPPHRHFISTPTGELRAVGPQICKHPELQAAFNQFHHNVHHSLIPNVGVIDTLGPQDGAPGLHDGYGAELMARLCSFTG